MLVFLCTGSFHFQEGIIDDEIEITLESPRDGVHFDDTNNSVLKLVEAGVQLGDLDAGENGFCEKMDIPAIIITDINNDRGDQGEIGDAMDEGHHETKDEFTDIVSEAIGDSKHMENFKKETEKQNEFSDILSDTSVNAEVIDANEDDVSDNKSEIVLQPNTFISDDTGKDDSLANTTTGNVPGVLESDSKIQTEVKQNVEETNMDEGKGVIENSENKMGQMAKDIAMPSKQQESEVNFDTDYQSW